MGKTGSRASHWFRGQAAGRGKNLRGFTFFPPSFQAESKRPSHAQAESVTFTRQIFIHTAGVQGKKSYSKQR